jgi:hypothetical protein
MAQLRDADCSRLLQFPGRLAVGVFLLTLIALPRPALAEEFYFVLVFGHHGPSNLPRSTHTFATFVKATGEGPWADQYTVESHTISWSPATLAVRAARLRPEAGINLDLEASLHWALSLGARVSCWGPFQIRKELYDRALRQIARLQSGRVQYKAADSGFRTEAATNCFHAVSDIDTDHGLLDTGAAYGEAASYLVACHLERWMVGPLQTYEWVYDRLKLRPYSIVRRNLGGH